MKNIFIFIILVVFSQLAYSQENDLIKTQLNGIYNGKNLYFQNPFSGSGVGFCLKKVIVNETISIEQCNANAIQISLDSMHIKVGEPITLTIYHENSCQPRLLNPNAISAGSESTFAKDKKKPSDVCILKGHIYDSEDPYGEFLQNIKVELVSCSDDSFLGKYHPNSTSGEYVAALKWDDIYELLYSAPGYQSKRIIIDLSNIPDTSKVLWDISAHLGLEKLTELHHDTAMYELPFGKMSFDITKDEMKWDLDYANAMAKAFAYIKESNESEIQVNSLKIDNELKSIESKKNKQILYGVLIGLLIIMVLLFFSIRTSSLRKKTNTLVLKQKAEVEAQKALIEEKNAEIMDSIIYAKRIQSAILPPSKIVKEYLQESFILYKPKDVVAGDFYWMEQREGKVLFAAADCTGHGVPGAMVSVVCNNGLNRSVREYRLTDPGQILDKTREIVIQEFEQSEEEVKDGMDIALCSLEGKTLQYAGAHNPLWIIRKGKLLETKANKQPIGKFDKQSSYSTHIFDLEKGDSIYIFSDGYVDQFGGVKGKKFKSKAFKELLLSIQENSMEEQKKIIEEAFETWRGSIEQIDDVCVIGVRI